MNSRERILSAIKENQPVYSGLPDLLQFKGEAGDLTGRFISVLSAIGGECIKVSGWDAIRNDIRHRFPDSLRFVTLVPELHGPFFEKLALTTDAHKLSNVDHAVINGEFAIAENGSVWVTEDCMGHRALPFICQHLVVVVAANRILPTMHEAYRYIGDLHYGFASFIAGPSKTADIEQSLVIGAHGPKSMTVYLMDEC